jgi:hypothetical protein
MFGGSRNQRMVQSFWLIEGSAFSVSPVYCTAA